MRPVPVGKARRGVALVAALGLLMLAAALLAGSAVAAAEVGRAARTLVAAARAEAEARRALGVMVQGWDTGLDSLPVGGAVERAVGGPPAEGPPVATRAVVRRVAARLYVAAVTVRVGGPGPALAVRRARLLLWRDSVSTEGATAAPVAPLARWSVAGLR